MSENLRTHALVESFRFNYKATRRVIGREYTPEQLLFQGPNGGPNLYWLVAHLTVVPDALLVQGNGGFSPLPEGFTAKFTIGSQPPTSLDGLPSFAELMQLFMAVHERALELMAAKPDSALDTPFESGFLAQMFGTPEQLYRNQIFHIGYHAGQIMSLRKLLGLPSNIGM